jgi:hypothetical protein
VKYRKYRRSRDDRGRGRGPYWGGEWQHFLPFARLAPVDAGE